MLQRHHTQRRAGVQSGERKQFELAIIGAGVLGTALCAEALRLGLKTVLIGPDEPSRSFRAGRYFRLNTWRGADQHGPYEVLLPTQNRFPRADHLSDASTRLRRSLDVPWLEKKVTGIRSQRGLVHIGSIQARFALIATGWGQVRTEPGTRLAKKALDFSTALERLAAGRLNGRRILVVGGGPSALSFIENCTADQRVIWLKGTRSPQLTPRVGEMFAARYDALPFEGLPRRVKRLRRIGRVWIAVDDRGDEHRADVVVWCAGFEAPLELISRRFEVFRHDGVPLAIQRTGAPIFQVGPALDSLGLASWDMGPFAEWYEKGIRLLRWMNSNR